MSPIGVILEDGDQSEMGAGDGLEALKAASSSKCSASPDLRAEAATATQGPSDTSELSLDFHSPTPTSAYFLRVHLASSLVRSFFSILLQCLYLIPSLLLALHALLSVI